MMREYLRRSRARVRQLWRDNRGNVAITFGLALIPLAGAVGAAVDYSRANAARTSLQGALDATALLLSREATSLTQAQLAQKAQTYVQANFNNKDAKELAVTTTLTTTSGGELHLKANAKLDTTIANILGIPYIGISTETTVKWGNTRLRVALVLDTTGSMDDAGKMPALKTAAKNLLTQLKGAATNNGDVYVSIVPFSKNVNVGPSNYTASWLDWTDWEAEPEILDTEKNGSKPNSWYTTTTGSSCPFGTSNSSYGFRCVSQPQGTSNISSIASSGNYRGLICPGTDGGNKKSTKIGIIYNGCYNTWTKCVGSACNCTKDNPNCTCSGSGSNRTCQTKNNSVEHTWRPTNTNATYTPALTMNGSTPYATPPRSTWNGCITDRGTSSAPSNDYDRKVTSPSTNITASLFPAEQNSYCSPEVKALSYDWTSMNSAIDALYPLGATNQPIGLVWGWQSLVGGGPFPAPPPKNSNYTYKEVVVLMSDGLNTLDRWYGNGSSTNTSVDQRMYQSATVGTCANVKSAGITIYAVHVNTSGDPMSTLLKNCATAADKFWMVTNGAALNDVFKQIGTELSQLRITK